MNHRWKGYALRHEASQANYSSCINRSLVSYNRHTTSFQRVLLPVGSVIQGQVVIIKGGKRINTSIILIALTENVSSSEVVHSWIEHHPLFRFNGHIVKKVEAHKILLRNVQ